MPSCKKCNLKKMLGELSFRIQRNRRRPAQFGKLGSQEGVRDILIKYLR
jgi:hypothetical protein